MRQLRTIYSLVVISLVGMTAWAGVPQLINFQGQLKNNTGSPLVNDTLAVEFKIYDAVSAGNVKWSEIDTVRTDANGLFTILLGKKTLIPDSVFNDSLRWLGIKVGSDPEISPRSQLSSVGYSYVSSQWTSAGQDLYRLNGSVGIGTASPTATLDVGGTLLVQPFLQFVGINRLSQVSNKEYFGILAPVGTGTYGGMYISTGGADGWPFYGYRTLNNVAWTYLDGQTGNWKLYNKGDRITVQNDGKVGIGTTNPLTKLDIRGDLTLDAGADPVLYTSSLGGEQNRYLALINSPSSPSASGLKAGGVLVADDYSYANPGKNDLIVKGDLQVGGNIIGSTPWTAFPFAAGIENYGGSQAVQYRKIGDMVYLRGSMHKADNSAIGCLIVGTLPVGFRPPVAAAFMVNPGYTIYIGLDGSVYTDCNNGYDFQWLEGIFFSTSP